ncbi:tautomerase family protein [Agrobacterium tumefaciens]|uniref:Tautomerase n=1 Tax=Agrobacterium tumefaciens TaxID=358 RepID=A0A2L2LL22_AGRTU|nr:tautomerase family protein [Agrobacterium tumefaciens]AVH45034.1 tautomerase [Agrobacterium tumefaciens]NSY98925.1 tautomerase family protein [Agrobacterium tumefaciens]
MPLLKLHTYKGRSEAENKLLLDAAHQAMLAAFKVPERDRYQLLFEHEPTHLQALDTGLGFERTQKFVLVEVVSRPRSRADKLAFYEGLANELQRSCGIPPSDLMISFVENGHEDWSFGGGTAQFVTGQL